MLIKIVALKRADWCCKVLKKTDWFEAGWRSLAKKTNTQEEDVMVLGVEEYLTGIKEMGKPWLGRVVHLGTSFIAFYIYQRTGKHYKYECIILGDILVTHFFYGSYTYRRYTGNPPLYESYVGDILVTPFFSNHMWVIYG